MAEITTSTLQVKGLIRTLKPSIKMNDEQLDSYIKQWFMVEA